MAAVRTTVRQFNLPNGYQSRDHRPNYAQSQLRYYDGPGNRQQVNFESDGRRHEGPRPRTTPPGQRPGYSERPRRQRGSCWTCGAPDHHSQFCPKATQAPNAFGDRKEHGSRGRREENPSDIHYANDGKTIRLYPTAHANNGTEPPIPCLECSSVHERAVSTCYLNSNQTHHHHGNPSLQPGSEQPEPGGSPKRSHGKYNPVYHTDRHLIASQEHGEIDEGGYPEWATSYRDDDPHQGAFDDEGSDSEGREIMFTRAQPNKATTDRVEAGESPGPTPVARAYLSTKRFLQSPFPVVDSGSTINMVGENGSEITLTAAPNIHTSRKYPLKWVKAQYLRQPN